MPTRDDSEAPPLSCSTHLSKEVLTHLARAHLGSAAWDFCAVLHNHTFGNAGWHRQSGHQETWCTFHLAAWASELGCTKSNLQRVLKELEVCAIIVYIPDPQTPGTGRIGWNTQFEAWQRYDGRRAKARHAEGAQKQPVIRMLPVTAPAAASVPEETAPLALLDQDNPCAHEAPHKISTDACSKKANLREISMASRLELRKISTPACLVSHKISTDASFDTASEAAPSDYLRKKRKK